MQSRRRRRDGSAVAGIDRLIPFAIRRLITTLDIWRQRNMTDAVDRVVDVDPFFRPQTDGAATVKMTCEDFTVKAGVGAFEDDARAEGALVLRSRASSG